MVKLTLFEQLFDMTKPKLMTFRWFAWCYNKWRAAIEYLRSLPLWRGCSVGIAQFGRGCGNSGSSDDRPP